MSISARRLLGVTIVTAVFLALVGLYIGLYLTAAPGASAALQSSAGTNLYLATVPAAALNDPHPTWVSYYTVNAQSGDWRHNTTFTLPANTLVHVTIYNFDSQTGLRNEFLGAAQGTQGGTFGLNGKTVQMVDPGTASHVFAIPEIGVSVPVYGIADDAKNPCSNAPCPLSTAHSTTTFTFRTPGKGMYRWQCFVPCAAGYIEGFGGPMQTVGYMDGFIKVV